MSDIRFFNRRHMSPVSWDCLRRRYASGPVTGLYLSLIHIFMSTACGTVMAAILVTALEKSHAMNYLKGVLEA